MSGERLEATKPDQAVLALGSQLQLVLGTSESKKTVRYELLASVCGFAKFP